MKWKNCPHRQNTWVEECDFFEEEAINKFNELSVQEKTDLEQKEARALLKSDQRCKVSGTMPELARWKLEIWQPRMSKAIKLWKEDYVQEILERGIRQKYVKAKVKSQREGFGPWEVFFRHDGGLIKEWSCTCPWCTGVRCIHVLILACAFCPDVNR